MSASLAHNDDDEIVHDGHDEQNEDRPLLEPTSQPKTRLSVPFLIALTCINGGLQVFFSTTMANLAPYLHTLSLSKSTTASIIISIPLAGAFVGPSVGTLSDRLQTRWGRRRPIIFIGAVSTITFLTLLAWTPQLVSGNDTAVRALAVFFTILLAISIQPVQAGVRALMVDIAPPEEQSRVSAYASRIQGAMAIFSFYMSSITFSELPGLEPLTQFQALACLNFITLGSTVSVACFFVHEEDSRRKPDEQEQEVKYTVLSFFKEIWRNIWELPRNISRACQVQFASWMAWFPLLFYTTTYIGELEKVAESGKDQLAQSGSIASLCFAILGFLSVLLLPLFFRQTKSLVYLWIFTQPLLGLLLVLTLVAVYAWQGIALIAIAGLPWAVTQWVPWALIGFETSRLGLDGDENRAGAILGIHNMAISLPQVLSGGVSIVTYRIAEAAGSEVPTAWVLASSGVAAFVAGGLARRLL